jgi:hypothetical protein
MKTNPDLIKVINLKEDRYVFFDYKVDGYYIENNPFVICNDNNDECSENIKIYQFLKENNYTIKIYAVPEDSSYPNIYYYVSYSFFPIFENTFKYIEQGYYEFSGLQIFAINMENKIEAYILRENIDTIYYSISEKDFTIDNLKDHNLVSIYTLLMTIEPQKQRIKHVLFILVKNSDNKDL